jgi:hypothetical protein
MDFLLSQFVRQAGEPSCRCDHVSFSSAKNPPILSDSLKQNKPSLLTLIDMALMSPEFKTR